MDESHLDSLNADERPPKRPDLEAMTVEEVSRRLDDVASREDSWRRFELRVHDRLGLPLIGERGIRNGCPLDLALIAVHYRLTFGTARVALLPKSEAADHTWPIAVEKAPPEFITAWQMLRDAVFDHALRARFAHLLFQAKAGSGRDLAGAASDEYLQAVADGWGPIDRMDFAHAALRLALAVKDSTRAHQAALAVRDEAIRCLGDNARGIAARGVVILAGVQSLPFDFHAVAEQVVAADIGDNNCDHVYAAWIDRGKPGDREPLWRRRVQAAVDAAEAAGGLVAVSKLYAALHLAERSGVSGLRRDVAARLQKAGQGEFEMMHMPTVVREYEEAVTETADAMIDADSLGPYPVWWTQVGLPCL